MPARSNTARRDLRNVLERASARETAMRVAWARSALSFSRPWASRRSPTSRRSDRSSPRGGGVRRGRDRTQRGTLPRPGAEQAMIEAIDAAKARGRHARRRVHDSRARRPGRRRRQPSAGYAARRRACRCADGDADRQGRRGRRGCRRRSDARLARARHVRARRRRGRARIESRRRDRGRHLQRPGHRAARLGQTDPHVDEGAAVRQPAPAAAKLPRRSCAATSASCRPRRLSARRWCGSR